MCKTVDFLVRNAKGLYVLGGVIIAVAGWFFMMNGLPTRIDITESRVAQLEKDVSELKAGIAEQNVKTSLILQSLYEIRGVLLKGK